MIAHLNPQSKLPTKHLNHHKHCTMAHPCIAPFQHVVVDENDLGLCTYAMMPKIINVIDDDADAQTNKQTSKQTNNQMKPPTNETTNGQDRQTNKTQTQKL